MLAMPPRHQIPNMTTPIATPQREFNEERGHKPERRLSPRVHANAVQWLFRQSHLTRAMVQSCPSTPMPSVLACAVGPIQNDRQYDHPKFLLAAALLPHTFRRRLPGRLILKARVSSSLLQAALEAAGIFTVSPPGASAGLLGLCVLFQGA